MHRCGSIWDPKTIETLLKKTTFYLQKPIASPLLFGPGFLEGKKAKKKSDKPGRRGLNLAFISTRWMSPVPSRAELRAAARLLWCVFFAGGKKTRVSLFFFVAAVVVFSERRLRVKKNFHTRSAPSHVRRHSSKPPPRRRKRSGLAAEREGLGDLGWDAAERRVRCFFFFLLLASERVRRPKRRKKIVKSDFSN